MSANTKLATWHDLRSTVDTQNGVHRVTMETLRELHGRQRVGKHILLQIEDKLRTLGIGHLPQELPNRQQQAVLLYALGTPASEVISAILTGDATDVAYTWLYRLNTLPDPSEVVSKSEVNATLEGTLKSVMAMLEKTQSTETPNFNGSHVPEQIGPRQELPEIVKALIPRP